MSRLFQKILCPVPREGGEGRQQVLAVSLVLCVSCRVLGQGMSWSKNVFEVMPKVSKFLASSVMLRL